MSVYSILQRFSQIELERGLAETSFRDVENALGKNRLTAMDFLSLLSVHAEPYLEEMAQKAHRLTLNHFGRVIHFFTPMYLSNFCNNHCVYCGFNAKNTIERKHLTLDEVEREAEAISRSGLKHILILTGEDPVYGSLEYLEGCVSILKNHFSSIAIEIYALSEEGYARLEKAGVDSLTIYQETYDEVLYSILHPKGPKKDYRYRLDAPERGLKARLRAVGVGALLGLADWRKDIFYTALHADYLLTHYPEAEISISLPRIRPHEGCYQPAFLVEDIHIVQMMTAIRLFLPRVGITISTRESAAFRDNILRLGVTRMSAGSTTAVGGHTQDTSQTGQFEIADRRSVDEMTRSIKQLGYQPVFKDWHPIL